MWLKHCNKVCNAVHTKRCDWIYNSEVFRKLNEKKIFRIRNIKKKSRQFWSKFLVHKLICFLSVQYPGNKYMQRCRPVGNIVSSIPLYREFISQTEKTLIGFAVIWQRSWSCIAPSREKWSLLWHIVIERRCKYFLCLRGKFNKSWLGVSGAVNRICINNLYLVSSFALDCAGVFKVFHSFSVHTSSTTSFNTLSACIIILRHKLFWFVQTWCFFLLSNTPCSIFASCNCFVMFFSCTRWNRNLLGNRNFWWTVFRIEKLFSW